MAKKKNDKCSLARQLLQNQLELFTCQQRAGAIAGVQLIKNFQRHKAERSQV